MIGRNATPPSGIRALVARPGARAGAVLVALWIGTAVILRGSDEFGAMIATLTLASIVLGGFEAGARPAARGLLVGQSVLWAALLFATAWVLWEHPGLVPMMGLFGAAAAWFLVAEPLLAARSRA